jgi:ABC-type Zn2+ transport system substrate-binding protein/surface adhesin
MSQNFTLKSILVLAALTLAAGAATAGEEKQCFEDGLKNNWSTPTPNISLHHEAEHENEHDLGDKHASEMAEHHHGDIGGGISVSPVSEPATDAMLLAGLVMVGTLVRRKSKTTGSAFNAALAA